MAITEITETILREIQRQLKDALENAARDRELAHRAIASVDRFESRIDNIAADIRIIRSDIASIDIKLASLPNLEIAIRALKRDRQPDDTE